jgi:hypothetical protein
MNKQSDNPVKKYYLPIHLNYKNLIVRNMKPTCIS